MKPLKLLPLASCTASLFVTMIIVIGFSCRSVKSCPVGENPDNITWCSNEDTIKTKLDGKFDSKGLQPWFDLSVSFINTVLKDEPYDIILKAKDGDIAYQSIATGYAIGVVVCCGFGILFCLLMPIVGFCFCCCRCCGKCGGEMVQEDDPRNACKRVVFALILLIITLLMLSGVLLTFVCNDRMSNALDAGKTTGHNVIDEAKGFIEQTLKGVDKVIGEFRYSVEKIKNDTSTNGVRTLVADPAFSVITPIVEAPVQKVKNLSEEAKIMGEQLDAINNNTDSLRKQSVTLGDRLNVIKKNLTDISKNCTGPCKAPNLDGLDLQANFSNVPNISEQLSNIQEILNSDFAGAAEKGLETFKEIPQTLINKTRDSRDQITKLVGDAERTVQDLISNLSSSVNETVYKQLDKGKTSIDDAVTFGKTYDKYRWYAGVGLTCILLLIVVFLGLGLMCGVCGHDKEAVPTTRGTVSNMGGQSLMAAVGFCFIFASFLMLLTTICFIIGTPLQKVCQGLENDGLYKHVLDKKDFMGKGKGYLLGDLLYQNGSIDLTIHGLLDDCRKNKPIYDAAKVKNKIDVNKTFNIKELLGDTVDNTLDELKINLTDQEILTAEAEKNLNNLSDSGVDKIEFDKFLNETKKGITQVNLTEFSTNVTRMAESLENASQPAEANRCREIAKELIELDHTLVAGMKAESDQMELNVNKLKKSGGNLKNKSIEVLDSARQAEDYIKNTAGKVIENKVKTYVNRVLGWGYKFTDHLVDVLQNDLAKCKPVSNIHDAIISAVCKEFVYPFNGFWLAIGFCLFFFIPAIIFSVKLAKHYRRMQYEPDFEQAYNQNEMYEMGQGHPILPQYTNGQSVGQEKKLWPQPQSNPAYPNQY